MYAGQDFKDASQSETNEVGFDFTVTAGGDLSDPPTTVAFTLCVVQGVDTDVATRIVGNPGTNLLVLNGFVAVTLLRNLQPGVRYRLSAVATLTSGQVKELFAFVTGATG